MNIVNYVLAFVAVTTVGMLYDRYSKKYYPDEELDKYNLVRKYLLNEGDSMLGKPFIWIHTPHKINARNWASFKSRNTLDLNEPYKNLCVKSIMKHCGESFKICLIDDSSFEKLIPDWSIRLDELSNPIKTRIRTLALSRLIHTYGGFLMPNSTIVVRDLRPLYDELLKDKDMFCGELINRSNTNLYTRFFPNHKIMGGVKGSLGMKELIDYLGKLISKDNTDEATFEATINRFLYKLARENKCEIIDGKELGVKSKTGDVVLLDNWLGEQGVEVCNNTLNCVVLPDDEILSRTKYQWFSRMSPSQVLNANTQISKYLLISLGK